MVHDIHVLRMALASQLVADADDTLVILLKLAWFIDLLRRVRLIVAGVVLNIVGDGRRLLTPLLLLIILNSDALPLVL